MVGARLKTAKRATPHMAGSRTTSRKKKAGRKSRRRPPTLAERFALPKLPALPPLEQRHMDVLGLALAALSIFFGLVFYLGWDGGKVGGAMGDGFVFLFGAVAYLLPVALFGWGTLLVMRPMLPTVKPFKTGSLLLLTALMLGLAAQTFGLGGSDPPRHGAFAQSAFFEHHGGVIGETLFWIARTLFSRAGAHILFVFLLVVGILFLSGATVSGLIAALRKPALPKPAPRTRPPEVEPVVRATHVEMPEPIEPVWEPEPEPEPVPPEEGVTPRHREGVPAERVTPQRGDEQTVTAA